MINDHFNFINRETNYHYFYIEILIQALVMAMRQAGEDSTVCDSFSTDLESWIAHILKRKIKFGKTKIRKTDDYSATPANFVLKHLVRNVF